MLQGLAVLGVETCNQLLDTRQVLDFSHALACRPNGFPGFGLIAHGFELGTEVDLALALQRGHVETGGFQALAHETRGDT